jgi:hypothetical protein
MNANICDSRWLARRVPIARHPADSTDYLPDGA